MMPRVPVNLLMFCSVLFLGSSPSDIQSSTSSCDACNVHFTETRLASVKARISDVLQHPDQILKSAGAETFLEMKNLAVDYSFCHVIKPLLGLVDNEQGDITALVRSALGVENGKTIELGSATLDQPRYDSTAASPSTLENPSSRTSEKHQATTFEYDEENCPLKQIE